MTNKQYFDAARNIAATHPEWLRQVARAYDSGAVAQLRPVHRIILGIVLKDLDQ